MDSGCGRRRACGPSWGDGGLARSGAIRAAVPGTSSPLGDPSDERQAVMDAMAKAIADELGVDDFEDAWDIAPRPCASRLAALAPLAGLTHPPQPHQSP